MNRFFADHSERGRGRFRINNCCLAKTDSPTAARTPPGLASRKTVMTRWTLRISKSRITHPTADKTRAFSSEIWNSPRILGRFRENGEDVVAALSLGVVPTVIQAALSEINN